MKRSPIDRKAPLRSKTPLKRTQAVKPRTAIKAVSDKRVADNRKYAVLRRQYLAAHPFCEYRLAQGIEVPATEIHHKAGRAGKMLCDTEFFAAVSSDAHREIHANPEQSHADGWMVSRHGKGGRA